MSYIAQFTRAIAAALKPDREAPLTLAYRSTMRPEAAKTSSGRSSRRHSARLRKARSNWCQPQFLRQSERLEDIFNPSKIVIARSAESRRQHGPLNEGWLRASKSPAEAEITKFVDNSWHAVKVLCNEIGRWCQNSASREGSPRDLQSRHKLTCRPTTPAPRASVGSACQKDVRALQYIAADTGSATHLVTRMIPLERGAQAPQFLQRNRRDRTGAKVLLVGLDSSWKPMTSGKPAVEWRETARSGLDLDIYDPKVAPDNLVGQNLGYAYSLLPRIDGLMVTKKVAESRDYARIIATNRLIDTLAIEAAKVVDTSSIA